MARTTASAVEDVLGGHYDGTTSLTAFIDTASSLVDKVVTADTDSVLSSSDLEIIERWLAGHFYAHSDQITQTKSTGRASATFQGQTAMALNSTQYGQTAMVLDCTGELSKLSQQAMNGKKKVTMTWLGTRYKDDDSERTSDQ